MIHSDAGINTKCPEHALPSTCKHASNFVVQLELHTYKYAIDVRIQLSVCEHSMCMHTMRPNNTIQRGGWWVLRDDYC